MNHNDKKDNRALVVYAAIFFILVLGIAFSGYFSYHNFEEGVSRQAKMQVSAIARLKVTQLADWHRERLADAQFFYHNQAFSELVDAYFENPADVETRNQIISLMEYYHSYANYESIFLLDVRGIRSLMVPANAEELYQATPQLIAQAAASLDSGEVKFLDFQRDLYTNGKIYISILIPLFSDQGDEHPLGVLVLKINPVTYLYPYINEWPIPSDTAETLLIRRDGEDVLFLNQVRFQQNAALNLRIPLTDIQLPAVKAVLGQTGIVEGTDYRGKLVLADVSPVPDSPWFLVSKVDVDEVYMPLQERLWQTLLMAGLAILVAGAGLVSVWRQQLLAAYRSKAELTEALRDSEEKFRKAFILSPDSININRLSDGMYISINNGFTRIMGYTSDEVIGRSSLELDIWADPQDRKKLVEGLKKSGEVQNLEASFRAKNGEKKYGLMSASVLELNGLPHIISITRDITGRRQAEDALRESEENLSITLHSIGDGVISTDKSGLIVNMNPMAEKYCGWTLDDARGKPLAMVFNILDAETREKVPDPVTKVMGSGQVVGLANHTLLISKSGVEYQIADSAAPIKDKNGGITGVVLVFSDVTEKYIAMKKLRESEANFADIFQTVSEGIVHTTLNGEVLSINGAFEKILEIHRGKIVGIKLLSLAKALLSREDFKKILPVIDSLTQGNVIQPFELKYKDKILGVSAAINRTSGRITGVIRDITEQKQAEEVLAKNEALLKTVQEVAHLGSWEIDLSTKTVIASEESHKIYGITHGSMTLADVQSVPLPEYRPMLDAALASLITEGKPYDVDFEIRRKSDGQLRYVHSIAEYSTLSRTITGSIQDITERKWAQEALRESEAKFRNIIELSPAPYALNDDDQNITYLNSAFINTFGYELKDIPTLSDWWTKAYPDPEYRQWAAETWQAHLDRAKVEGTGFEPMEINVCCKNGATRTVIVSAGMLGESLKGTHLVIFHDITERKLAEAALRDSEEHYRTVVSNAPVVTFVTDEKGIFTLSEGKGLAKLGLQPGQVVGLSVNDVYHDYPSIINAMQNALAGQAQRQEVEVQGTVFDVFYTPVFDQHGAVMKVIGVSTDVTERKQAEDQIRQFNMKLEQSVYERTVQLETTNKELEAFSYSVSHDLRAPLRGIDGWSQALLEDYMDKLDEQGQLYIQRVRSETQRMGHLIDDMLLLSRLTRVEMMKEQVDLSVIAQGVIERLGQQEPERQVDFSIQPEIKAEGDPHLLESVLSNLLGNAFKFTGKRAGAHIEFGQTDLKDQRVFFVRDNGVGFNMAYAQKLFGAFQRMHKVSEFPGTGIGLATVQRIIHRHGGRIWAESEIDCGATFYFTLG